MTKPERNPNSQKPKSRSPDAMETSCPELASSRGILLPLLRACHYPHLYSRGRGLLFHASRSDALKVAVGFIPRLGVPSEQRRVATKEHRPRFQSSLRDECQIATIVRGLKATATITQSLRDSICVAAKDVVNDKPGGRTGVRVGVLVHRASLHNPIQGAEAGFLNGDLGTMMFRSSFGFRTSFVIRH